MDQTSTSSTSCASAATTTNIDAAFLTPTRNKPTYLTCLGTTAEEPQAGERRSYLFRAGRMTVLTLPRLLVHAATPAAATLAKRTIRAISSNSGNSPPAAATQATTADNPTEATTSIGSKGIRPRKRTAASKVRRAIAGPARDPTDHRVSLSRRRAP